MTTADQKFLTQLNMVVGKRISENTLSSETLADDFCLSQRHFSRRVKSVTGVNTALYIRSLRIKKACELLRDTDLTISEIFVECGFDSANYFSRVFKQVMGMSPSEYRKEEERKQSLIN